MCLLLFDMDNRMNVSPRTQRASFRTPKLDARIGNLRGSVPTNQKFFNAATQQRRRSPSTDLELGSLTSRRNSCKHPAAALRRSTGITEMNRLRLVLFEMNNRMFGPYLEVMDRILFPVMTRHAYPHMPSTPVWARIMADQCLTQGGSTKQAANEPAESPRWDRIHSGTTCKLVGRLREAQRTLMMPAMRLSSSRTTDGETLARVVATRSTPPSW
jgi:hypothetical protein